MDLALRNALIIDGSGHPAFSGDLGVAGGRIAAIGGVAEARQEIDLQGAAVAPGFIDTHTHYDAQALWDPILSPSSLHGVTTVLGGNCGFTLAPLSGRPEDLDYILRMLSRVEGMPLAALRKIVRPTWTSFGGFLDRLEGTLAINAGFLVGHSALRRAVMGERAVGGEATDDELAAMGALLDRSIAEGGLGFSTTTAAAHLDYEGRPVPSRWASLNELRALAEIVGRHSGTWLEIVPGSIHFTDRDYVPMTEMAVAANRPLNWNVYIIAADQPEAFSSQLAASDHAAARGADVFGLVQAGPSTLRINLRAGLLIDALPVWREVMALPHEEKCRALADPATRARLEEAPRTDPPDGPKFLFRDWGALTIEETFRDENSDLRGRRVADLAAMRGKSPIDAMLDLALEEGLLTCFAPPRSGDDEASWALRASAWTDNERCLLGGSDAGAHLDMADSFTLPTRLLGEGVRARRLIPLEEAVRQLTAVPAQRFGLIDRGEIAPGMIADLVVFDPASVAPGAITPRFDLPGGEMRLFATPVGIHMVIVNGEIVVREGEPTGRRPGTVLRSGRDTRTVDPAAWRGADKKRGQPASHQSEANA